MQCSQIMSMGNFIFPNISWETIESKNSDIYLLLEGIRGTYLYQHTFEPTRGRMSNERHILDLILTPDEHDIIDIKNLSPLGKSDHSIIEFKLNCMSWEKYNYNKGDYIGLQNYLIKIGMKYLKTAKMNQIYYGKNLWKHIINQ